MVPKIRIGISACLIGKPVRYDGGHKRDPYLMDTLGRFVEWVPVCPEVECGLPVPREPMRLVGEPESPRLVTIRSGIDHTDRMLGWTKKKLKSLGRDGLCGFIFKSRSPSSGLRGVRVYSSSGVPGRIGRGIFAGAFVQRFPAVPVEDEGRLHDPEIRRNFIERIFTFKRWRDFVAGDGSPDGLLKFHTEHKLTLMSHSRRHYTMLDRMIAGAVGKKDREFFDRYIEIFMDAMRLKPTVKKNTNVLLHTMKYFKKFLSPDEKARLIVLIEDYSREIVPLPVPVALINHYAWKYDQQYLKRQLYLNPYPAEPLPGPHV
jgi:uncharacterized protein YbbK (DUF523 family)/uncharacterized protein YbgA (DUF1722 family)